ncbi:hypothetical protein ACIQOV_24930, partial [Kitasatospora sp. NPDC091257]|uniref:hypothetical protein n=1 Tax=Kitasatospora sp. NPDC091257 TaxID=3364084 RepID=UPI0038249EDD
MDSNHPPIWSSAEDAAPQPPRKAPLRLARFGATFLGVSVVSGVLLAGLALPVAGGIGLAAKNTAEGFEDVPSDFKTPPLTQATQIFDAKG